MLPPLDSPLRAYQIRGADLYTIGEAENQLAGDCMKRFGFDQPPSQLDRDQMIAEQRVTDTRLYGITDLATAQQYGYLLPPSMLADSPEPEQSEAYQFVFWGQRGELSPVPPPGGWTSPGEFGGLKIPAGGCLGEARTMLWGGPFFQAKDQLAGDLRMAAYSSATADARVQQALADWSACMGEAGFRYQSPLDIEFDRPDGADPSPEEINTAVADIGCKQKVDLVARWNKVDVEYQKKAIEENQLELAETKAEIDAALARAADVLAG